MQAEEPGTRGSGEGVVLGTLVGEDGFCLEEAQGLLAGALAEVSGCHLMVITQG